MKKIISVTIALCLVFCSILPVYAEAWTNTQADSVTRNVADLLNATQNLYRVVNYSLTYIVEDINSPNSSILNMYGMIQVIASALADYTTGWSSLVTSIFQTESNTSLINTNLGSLLGQFNSNGSALGSPSFIYRQDFVPYSTPTAYAINSTSLSVLTRDINGQIAVGWPNRNPASLRQLLLIMANNNMLQFSSIYSIGTKYIRSAYDKFTGNGLTSQNAYTYLSLMDLLYDSVDSIHLIDKFYWHTLQHYGDNLTTWDSQGSTLTQVAFTPDSLAQGLYRYLAFTQRDVARLAYVFANDEELEARQLAQANQEQIIDDFIDPNGSGSVSASDFGSMAGASDSVKDNFNTGYSSSNVWDIFNSDHYGWFSQECADSLDTTSSNTRSLKFSSGYDTPLLDSYYEQILSLGGDN